MFRAYAQPWDDWSWYDFDAVLLDLNLPDSDWSDTLRQIQQRVDDAPVIVLTGLDNADIGVQAIRAGAQDYWIKGEYDGNLLIRIPQSCGGTFWLCLPS